MKKLPVEVRLIGRKNKYYQIEFPNVAVPVEVNEELYKKMLESPVFKFIASNGRASIGKRHKTIKSRKQKRLYSS
ncbi:hypothetical protein [Aquimarina muelleri]|uniref:Uncharacterized protein n=1 Tax=Aquimarina muelleri TaxID=279356 RepID=A0A918JV72_9FLAO|nr:hypothetical protein [Aquimarina muelleri]MCX2761759.1 hypothetical protein [Aquimarina muelleri]GGX15972.1 hypothetical protein GCM10007384_16900 [Aquimarina muelleri]